tara:strand:- start:9466 stop:9945 length:480 start_codon:yes stop_codon:yes gene_type:complete
VSVKTLLGSIPNTCAIFNGPIAQRVEHPTHNRKVTGSNPVGVTTLTLEHIMEDLKLYFSRADEIEKLKEENRKLKNLAVQWKCKYKKIHLEVKKRKVLKSRTYKARQKIISIIDEGFEGTVISQIRVVAEEFNLSIHHAKDIWYEVNKTKTETDHGKLP